MKVLFPVLTLFVFLEATAVLGQPADQDGRIRGAERSSPQSRVLLDDVILPHLDNVLLSTRHHNTKQRRDQVIPDVISDLSTLANFTNQNNEVPVNTTPISNDTVPMDLAITKGQLDNGFSYYVMPNQEPPGQLELMLHIDAGANFELREEQRGLAHFMEHMMFQTTASFPEPGSLIPALQRLGIEFGRHANAYTTLDETVYTLSLPNTQENTLNTSMTWMKDVMGGALLEQSEIDLERGVILSELQARDSGSLRVVKQLFGWLLPDSIISKRFVIGTEETISNMDRDLFVEFYDQYYIPRRATFIAVGDVDADEMVALIEETFGGLPDSERGPEADYGTAPEGFGLRTKVFFDPTSAGAQISLVNVQPSEELPDTEWNRFKALNRVVANTILSKRLNDGMTGGADSSSLYNAFDMHTIAVATGADRWQQAVSDLEQEFRRVMTYGFTDFEVQQAKNQILGVFEQDVVGDDSRDSSELAQTINAAINGGFVVAAPEENLRIAAAALDATTPETVLDSFQSIWDTTDINLYMAVNPAIGGSEEDWATVLEALYLKSQEVEVENEIEDEEEPVVWSYTDFGPPGSVVSDTLVEDLDIRQLVLSNNVRVNMKQTDFDAGMISFHATFGKGMLGQPEDSTFLNRYGEYMLNNGGLGNHSISELQTIVTGKSISLTFAINEGNFQISGQASRDDLELAMQIMAAHFVDPGFSPVITMKWRSNVPSILAQVRSLSGTFEFDVFSWLLGGDERFVAPTQDELMSFVSDDAKDWLMPYLINSYVELSIVGDFEEDATLDLLLNTIGAIPERDDAPEENSQDAREVDVPAPTNRTFSYYAGTPLAEAWMVWEFPSFVGQDIAILRQTNVLAGIVGDRMRIQIREDLGGSYSPFAGVRFSESFDYGFLVASAAGAPDLVDVFLDILLGIAEDLAGGGITQDEFERALIPFQSSLQDTLRENGYWLSVMDQSQVRPYQLDWSRNRDSFYQNMTLDDVQELAREYLTVDQAYPLRIFPVDRDGELLGSATVEFSRNDRTIEPIANTSTSLPKPTSNQTETSNFGQPCSPVLLNDSTSVQKSGTNIFAEINGCEEEMESLEDIVPIDANESTNVANDVNENTATSSDDTAGSIGIDSTEAVGPASETEYDIPVLASSDVGSLFPCWIPIVASSVAAVLMSPFW